MQSEIQRTTNRQIEYEKMYALGELSAGIAHEIRNPLFAVRNNLDYLERRFSGTSDQQEIYEEMKEAMNRVSLVISSVLDYAKPHRLQFKTHEVHELVNRSLVLLKKQLEKEQVTVQVDLPEHLAPVEMDIHRMEQVLVKSSGTNRSFDQINRWECVFS
ncbi:MAG TPA: histidine kinase dimerization/phospho-acceptor domain-containing protein, partial [bacterium]|nr:histidine kinase dimerization/phospho-acceptor domain-containing protein [bacterium]